MLLLAVTKQLATSHYESAFLISVVTSSGFLSAGRFATMPFLL